MNKRRLCLGGLLSILCWLSGPINAAATTADDEARLLRFPAIHGDQVVFTYAGDLYTVPADGGVARRLTSDVGFEMFPRFSPDGEWLAFTAQYDGNTEVYLMPATGGVPKRLTVTATLGRDDVSDRMGPNNIVMTWRDRESIVFRSRANEWNPFKGRLMVASVDGGLPEEIPLPPAGWCSYSPDGGKLAFNRVFREFRTWKRYRGGQADDIWIYDFESKETTRITDHPAQDIFPMWHGERIYFVSDRGEHRRLNVHVYDEGNKTIRQVTHFADFDVKFPSLGDQAIVFENGGFLYRLDLGDESVQRIPVEIREDLAVGRDAWRDLTDDTTSYDIAPDGARAVIGGRGDVFSIPAEHGRTRNLTQTSGVHERNAVWSPDGRWIAYVSDASGEDEIHLRAQDGSGEEQQLTTCANTYKYAIAWSPDSKRILWSDKKNRLQFVEVESREVTLVDQSEAWEIRDFSWSPDSRWIAYTCPQPRRYPDIFLYSLDEGIKVRVTDGWFDVGNPEFSSDGKYLFFVSDRTFNPLYGQTEWNHVYRDMERIYLVMLAADTKSPFEPKNDEVKIEEESEKEEKAEADTESDAGDENTEAEEDAAKDEDDPESGKGKADKKKEAVKVCVDPEGLAERLVALPGPASSYGGLQAADGKLFYQRKGSLFAYDFKKEKETELGDVRGYRISANGKKMLVRSGGSFAIIDLPGGKIDTKDHTLDLSGMKVHVDREAEWSQIYHECWRQMRDFVYAPNLHGVDWSALRKRYAALVPYVSHRADLTYVIGELIGEINLGHCYVGDGDYPKPERVSLGLLGARLSRDESGFYRIEEILPGQNWDESLRSPLKEIGVDAHEGDFIVAIDGHPTDQLTSPYEALIGKAGRQVSLRLNDEPSAEGARDVTVVPIADEQPLYYLKWVLGNIAKIEEATHGRVGYVHIPDMGVSGLNEFAKFYYPQLHKEALIVDVRSNGGGNVSPMIIERLRREPVFWTIARNGAVELNPGGMMAGPKVMLVDKYSASDGDIVAYRFKHHGLGPVIGTRTWGGVVGMRGGLPLVDGGMLRRPEFSRFDLDAKEWVMEGKGVEPDIVVENDPAREYAGIDDQLNRAIEEILQALENQPMEIPEPPPYPDKTR
jgi:tricorn protease